MKLYLYPENIDQVIDHLVHHSKLYIDGDLSTLLANPFTILAKTQGYEGKIADVYKETSGKNEGDYVIDALNGLKGIGQSEIENLIFTAAPAWCVRSVYRPKQNNGLSDQDGSVLNLPNY